MSDAKGLDGESRSIPPRPPAPQGSGGDEDHKEDAANYVAGGMRCGKTLVMENAKLKAALATINEIRNSIIGLGTVNWSEHIYPLVEALGKAGFKGKGWPEAFNYCGTMLERTLKAEERLVVLEAEHAANTILLEVIQDEINLHDWGRYTTLARRKSEEAKDGAAS